MFALECFHSGYFSWKSYAINKAISLAFTIITCGVAAYLSRGAKFSKFGFKNGGDYYAKLSGKKLIEKVGAGTIAKQAAFQFGKKVVSATVTFAGNKLVSWISEHLQVSLLTK